MVLRLKSNKCCQTFDFNGAQNPDFLKFFINISDINAKNGNYRNTFFLLSLHSIYKQFASKVTTCAKWRRISYCLIPTGTASSVRRLDIQSSQDIYKHRDKLHLSSTAPYSHLIRSSCNQCLLCFHGSPDS